MAHRSHRPACIVTGSTVDRWTPTATAFLPRGNGCLLITTGSALQEIIASMPPKRNAVWDGLQEKMAAKRVRAECGKRGNSGTVPHEIIVQRLAAEPDSKQTFKPVSPREFVAYGYSELSLNYLKKACAEHFNLSSSSCDILVSNKGPSCSNINQIPHRKDKVCCINCTCLLVDFTSPLLQFSRRSVE